MSDAGSDWSVDEQALPEPSPGQLDALQRELETVRGALAAALLTTDDLRSRNQELAALIAEAGAAAKGESASRDSEALKCERAVELRWQLNDDLVVTSLGPRVGETPEVLMRGTVRTLSIAGLLDSDGLDALLPALRDETWPRLQAVNLVGHGLTQEQAERACEVATQRGLALCTCPTAELSWKLSGNPADVMLITTSLSSSRALTSTNLLGNNFDMIDCFSIDKEIS